jgi:two-component system chemotaxis sensor kinase CheA
MARIDNAELISCFKTEAAERVQKLNDGLLSLEKRQKKGPVLESLFREAHTLKGAAAMVGCKEISSLAHAFEDVLGGINTGHVQVKKAIGVLFQCCDAIKEILEVYDGAPKTEIDVTGLLEDLAEVSGVDSNQDTAPGATGEAIQLGPPDPADDGSFDDDEPATTRRSEESIRVAIDKLDCLANTVGEIVISRVKLASNVDVLRHVSEVVRGQNKIIQELVEQLRKQTGAGDDAVSDEITPALDRYRETNRELVELVVSAYGEQHDALCRIETVIDQLDSDVTALRMLPIASVFEVFPRIVRDLAEEYEKKVNIEIHGADTELDRTMLEGIKDPLMHLVRNAVDHGIETPRDRAERGKPPRGKISLSAVQDGDRVLVTLTDDGRGIDVDNVRAAAVKQGIVSEEMAGRMGSNEVQKLIFTPGFSTKTSVTNVSGRGVGTDVVKKYVEDNLNGRVYLESEAGRGSTFTLVLPLTLAVTPSVLVRVAGQLFAIPAHSVQIGLRVGGSELRSIDGKPAVNVIDSTVPLVRLDHTLDLPAHGSRDRGDGRPEENGQLEVVVVEHGNQRLAVVIDELVEEQDIVVKRLEPPLDNLKFVAGVTILEKGEVVPILHVHELIKSGQTTGTRGGERDGKLSRTKEEPKRNVLVVEDSLTTRELMKNIIKSAGFNVETAPDGVEALNQIAGKHLDLIVTDIEMPRMDGFEMTERIKKDPALKDIPVIMVTSMFLDEHRKRGLEVGADAYIRKGDFDQSKLIDTIKRLVV